MYSAKKKDRSYPDWYSTHLFQKVNMGCEIGFYIPLAISSPMCLSQHDYNFSVNDVYFPYDMSANPKPSHQVLHQRKREQ